MDMMDLIRFLIHVLKVYIFSMYMLNAKSFRYLSQKIWFL